jgi:DNA-binding beta-propeller fold protein YncE
MRKSFFVSVAVALSLIAVSSSQADVKTETVVGKLTNPCGVAIQPGTGHVFVADSGAKRVIRVVDGKAEDVIIDFPLDVYGKGPMFDIGPLGLAFIDADTLVVGGGGNIDDKELLRVYAVPKAGSAAIKASDMKANFGLDANEDLKAEGNYYGVAVGQGGIYVTCNGDDTKGWVAKADVKKNVVSNFRRFIATKEATEVDAPVAITMSPRGEVVVGQMGEITVPEDGLLTFYNAKNGKMLLNLETGLSDITGLAYSPKNGLLYATDFAWPGNDQAGLFRLDKDGKEKKVTINAKKITQLDKPTALAFAEDGTLYVTVIETVDGKNEGKLLKIAVDQLD